MAESYSYAVPTSSLSKIMRLFNARKAAGQIVQPWELEALYSSELGNLSSQQATNRQLSLAEKAQAETARANAITEALNAEKLAEAKREYESTLAQNKSQYESTLALQQAALEEQKRQADINASNAAEQLAAAKSASTVQGVGSALMGGAVADKLTGGALSNAAGKVGGFITDMYKNVTGANADIPSDEIGMGNVDLTSSYTLPSDPSAPASSATWNGPDFSTPGTPTTQPWDYDLNGNLTSTGKAVSLGTEAAASEAAADTATSGSGLNLAQSYAPTAETGMSSVPTDELSQMMGKNVAQDLYSAPVYSSGTIGEGLSSVGDSGLNLATQGNVGDFGEVAAMMGLDTLGTNAAGSALTGKFVPEYSGFNISSDPGAVEQWYYHPSDVLQQYNNWLAQGGTPLSQSEMLLMTYNPTGYANYASALNGVDIADAAMSMAGNPYNAAAGVDISDAAMSEATSYPFDTSSAEGIYAGMGGAGEATSGLYAGMGGAGEAAADTAASFGLSDVGGFPLWIASNILRGWGLGCIIVTACTDPHSPEVEIAREYRDKCMDLDQIRGYYMIAEKVVPLIKRSGIFKGIVKKVLVDSLVDYGRHALGKQERKPRLLSRIVSEGFLWLCRKVGKTRETFVRVNGEVV